MIYCPDPAIRSIGALMTILGEKTGTDEGDRYMPAQQSVIPDIYR
jgi:hypothetical protein